MSKLKALISIFAALVLVAGGLFLPDITTYLQDRNALEASERFETQRMHLNLDSSHDLKDVFSLLSGDYTQNSLDKGKNIGFDEVIAEATHVMDLLTSYGFAEFDSRLFEAKDVTPYLTIDTSSGVAFVLWDCTLYSREDSETFLHLQIDDESGKVVSFTAHRLAFDQTMLDRDEHIKKLTPMCEMWKEYYDLEDISFPQASLSDNEKTTAYDMSPEVESITEAIISGPDIALTATLYRSLQSFEAVDELDETDTRIQESSSMVSETYQVGSFIRDE